VSTGAAPKPMGDDVPSRRYGVAVGADDIPDPHSVPVQRPAAVLLAGPNGAGKTTASSLLLGSSVPFLNADLIAADLRRSRHSGAAVDVAAGRQLLAELAARVSQRQSFCVETNLAGRGWVHHIEEWRDVGYHVTLQFLALVDADTAIARVAQRVSQGGHGVPEEVIRRRYHAGLPSAVRHVHGLGREPDVV
jgi:predicted ABC-type ATPase